jgi:hypothetical protein
VLGASEFLGRSVACKDKPDVLSAWSQALAPGACMGSQTEQVSRGQRLVDWQVPLIPPRTEGWRRPLLRLEGRAD